jgi:uncharacterized membrane protein YgcG
LDHPDSDESSFLGPAEASQLLFGYVNTQVELLYLASQGKAQLIDVETDDFTVTLTESAVDPIGSVLNSQFIPTRRYSGRALDRILCRHDVSQQAEWELREQGYISGNCWTRLWGLALLTALPLVVTELGCAYQTVGSPLILGLVILHSEIASLVIFAYCFSHCAFAKNTDKFRNCALVVTAVFVLMGFGFYFDRPMLWDTFQGMIIGGLASTLMELSLVLNFKWTARGVRVAAGIIAYRKKLEVEGPKNEDDESELWRYLAYSTELLTDECLVLRMRPWFHWARSPVLDPDLLSRRYNGGRRDWSGGGDFRGAGGGEGGGRDWGGGGGDFGAGGGGGDGAW